MSYEEHDLQLKFIKWFTENHGYRELADDAETGKAASMDSVGFIGGQPVLIEIKRRFDAGRILYRREQSGSIEHKIARGLQSLYGRRQDQIATVLSEWDGKTAPHICLVAHAMSEGGRQQLTDMLRECSKNWWFIYTVYIWQDQAPVAVIQEMGAPTRPGTGHPEIPDLVHDRSVRTPPTTLSEFQKRARKNGVGDLFTAMVDHALRANGRAIRNVYSLNFSFHQHGSNARSTAVGVWPGESSKSDGLRISYSLPEIEKCFRRAPDIETLLPGESTLPIGHVGRNRYLRTIDEIDEFWRLMTSPA